MDRRWRHGFAAGALSFVLGACGNSGDDDTAMMNAQCAMPPCAAPPAGGMAAGGAPGAPIGGSTPATAGAAAQPSMAMSGTSGVGGTAVPAGGSGSAGTAGTANTAGTTAADAGPVAMPDAGGMTAPGVENQALPPISDYADDGPFDTTMESNVGPGSAYTIFRPDPLGEDGFLHSPLIFGPGIITTPSNYRTFLTHLASHGYVIICANSLTGGPNAPGNLQAMKDGLEWLIAQNDAAGPYQGKLAVKRAITMGYSIGATGSTQLSSHEAIITTVSIHGHNTSGDPHGPIWLITGTMDVIEDNRTTLTTLEEAPAILTALPIGHLNVLTELAAGGRYVAPITAWLRYWVNGDEDAKRFFWGDGCEMCESPWIPPETNAKWDAQTL